MQLHILTILALAGSASVTSGMQTITGSEPLSAQLPCADIVKDQAGGGCLQASSTPTMGALYPLSSDLFVDPITGWVGLNKTNPLARLDVGGNARLSGDLSFTSIIDGIAFSSWNPYFSPSTPMITMFQSGTSNPDRMILGHSPSFLNYGLAYRDATDEFVFQSSASAPTLTIDIGTAVTFSVDTFVYDEMDIQTNGPETALDVISTKGGSLFNVVNIERTNASYTDNDMLQIRMDSGSSASAQYIEAEKGGDIDFRVDGDGEIFSDVGITTPADFAEMIEVSTGAESIEPGDVVVIDPRRPRSVRISTQAHSRRVMGIYSTKPGVVGSEREWDVPAVVGSPQELAGDRIVLKRADMAELYDEVPVAVIGIVPAKVSAENGPIWPGDLLVTSDTPGHAMRAEDPRPGTIVGKALGSLAEGTGRIRVLVTLQ